MSEAQLRRALEVARRQAPGSERDRHELEVLLRLIACLSMTKGCAAPENGEALERARALCERLGATRELVPVLWGLMCFHCAGGGVERGRHLAEQLFGIAARSRHPAELVAAHVAVAIAAVHGGDLRIAHEHLEQALAVPEGLGDPWLRSWMPQHPAAACSTFLALTLALRGEPGRAETLAAEAVELGSLLGHEPTIVHALFFDAWLAAWVGDGARAQQRVEDLLPVAEKNGFSLYSAMAAIVRGWARAQDGDAERGISEMRDGWAAMEATGARILPSFCSAVLADAHRRQGRPHEALAVVDHALGHAQATGERFYEAELRRLRGELLLAVAGNGDGEEEAEAELTRAAAVARAQGSVALEIRAAESFTRLRTSQAK